MLWHVSILTSPVHNVNKHEADSPSTPAADLILPNLGRKFSEGAREKNHWVCFCNQTPFLFRRDTSLPPPNFLYYCFLHAKIIHLVHKSSNPPCRSPKRQTDIFRYIYIYRQKRNTFIYINHE